MENTLEDDFQNYQTGLLSLPEEVLYRCIFPYLQYTDLLRLRRVCKPILLFASDFIRNNFKTSVREINETNFPFQHYLVTDLPTTSIYINNSSTSIFLNPDIPTFLHLYGNQITSLKINHFATCLSQEELHFFSSLPNLLHLDITFIDATKRNCMQTYNTINSIKTRSRESCPFPQSFKKLRTLKLNEIQGSEKMDIGYAWDFIEFCDNLEYLSHPLYRNLREGMSTLQGGPFVCVMDTIMKRHQLNPNRPNLKYYDFLHFDDTLLCSFLFNGLVELCYEHKVKLLNVHCRLLDVAHVFERKPKVLKSTLVSLRNLHGYTYRYELPELKELVIQSTAVSSYVDCWNWPSMEEPNDLDDIYEPGFRPVWPNLNKLDLTIDSNQLIGLLVPIRNREPTEALLDFLFLPGNWPRRDELTELAIRFGKDFTEGKEEYWPVPKVENITQSCRFVNKLILGNWLEKNEEAYKFWEGLSCLEEVELEECSGLGDEAFVGRNWDDPAFMKLKRLRKVTLKGLDKMPQITDQVFKLVFSGLKIKQFCLTSEQPLKSITSAGIESLSTGEFNNFVEKFPFDTWSLDGVSMKTFTNLKLKFRASLMI